MENIIITTVIVLIVFSSVFYIYRAKKKGQKCIGCPHSKTCQECNCRIERENN